jgi:tRNA uridine 5-carboxymethylaminomethyl modification enzyme
MPLGHEIGLISDERLAAMETRQEQIRQEVHRLEKTIAPPNDKTNAFLEAHGTAPIALRGASLADLLRRPQLCYGDLAEIDPVPPALSRPVTEQVEIQIKYEGYIRRQLKDIEEQRRLEDSPLPDDIDYLSIRTLRTEARQKLQAVRPETLGQAGRISGVSPADVGALMVYLSHREEQSK